MEPKRSDVPETVSDQQWDRITRAAAREVYCGNTGTVAARPCPVCRPGALRAAPGACLPLSVNHAGRRTAAKQSAAPLPAHRAKKHHEERHLP